VVDGGRKFPKVFELTSIRSLIRTLTPNSVHFNKILSNQIHACSRGRVMAGPFTDMRYIDSSFSSAYYPKILGTYEQEIVEKLEFLLAKTFEKIVIAGAAEGYYAVGCALRTKANIYAFEANPQARAALLELAQKNRVVEQIRIEEICDVRGLTACTMDFQPNLLLMDIEGGEAILLDPEVIPNLQRAYIIVETHEFAVPGVSELLKHRFTLSHDITDIKSQPRVILDFPISKGFVWKLLFEGAAIQMMNEHRPNQMSWLIMSPKD